MITEFLPSRLPIIQAPLAGSQGVELCAAVCEAGGLGSLPAAMLTPSELRDQIVEIRRRTPAPFNVNFFCQFPPKQDPERETRWLEKLARTTPKPPFTHLPAGEERSVRLSTRQWPRSSRRRNRALSVFILAYRTGPCSTGSSIPRRKSIHRRLPWRKRNGWKVVASTRSSLRARKRAVIAGRS
jgi:NAD(P)H-dependent flavin oxidoreductase YrpB (nitropropane dioxygenase family)